MTLNRQSKAGVMIKGNIAKNTLVFLTAGVVALGTIGTLAYHNYSNNQNLVYSSSNYDSYGLQIEELFHVNIDEDKEQILNEFGDITEVINEYKNQEDYVRKNRILDSLIEKKSISEELSLKVLKDAIATKYGGNWSDYRIHQEKANDSWLAIGEEKTINLEGDFFNLACAIGNLQGVGNGDNIRKQDKEDKFIDKYENMIKETANLIKETSKTK